MKKRIFISPLIALASFLLILGCAGEPQKELSAAKEALENARGAEADRYVSDLFAEAENSVTEAENLIAQKNYGEAKKLLMKAKSLADSAALQAPANKEEEKMYAEDAIAESQRAMDQLKETQKIAQSLGFPKGKTDLSTEMPKWDYQLKGAQEEYDKGNFDVAKAMASEVYQQISAKMEELNELIMTKQK
jgi:hypothetical protein